MLVALAQPLPELQEQQASVWKWQVPLGPLSQAPQALRREVSPQLAHLVRPEAVQAQMVVPQSLAEPKRAPQEQR